MTRAATFYEVVFLDASVKSMETSFSVIPAQAGIQYFQDVSM